MIEPQAKQEIDRVLKWVKNEKDEQAHTWLLLIQTFDDQFCVVKTSRPRERMRNLREMGKKSNKMIRNNGIKAWTIGRVPLRLAKALSYQLKTLKSDEQAALLTDYALQSFLNERIAFLEQTEQ